MALKKVEKKAKPVTQDEIDQWIPNAEWDRCEEARPIDNAVASMVSHTAKLVAGVGPDAEIVTNDNGAKQSKVEHRLDLVPADAIFRMGETLKVGAERYAEWNWTGIPTTDHINHALIHLYAFLAGDTQDDHLGHAITRIAFAIHTDAHEAD